MLKSFQHLGFSKKCCMIQKAGAVAEENWFWGNHRGGGGAPLKDTTGKPVANLKKVIAGEVYGTNYL